MSDVNKCSAYTRFDREDCKFSWTIENIYYKIFKENESLDSPIFRAKCNKEFYFRLISEKVPLSKTDSVRKIYLCSKNITNEINCHYSGTVSEVGNCYCFAGEKILDEIKNSTICLISLKLTDKIFKNTVTISCNLILSRGIGTSFLESEFTYNRNEELIPKLNYDRLFLNEKFSDVMLRTASGKLIPGHKIVLAAASPVFNAMFSHDMLENKNQFVDMVDVNCEAAVDMLRYIYIGSVENRESSSIINLLVAADKYQLEELKSKCENTLISTLSIQNCLKMLEIADTYSANHLKRGAVNFIKGSMNGSLQLNELSDMLLSKTRSVSK